MATGHELELPATQSGAQSGAHATGGVGRGGDSRLTVSARLGLLVICLAVFLSALDQTVVVTALLPIIRDIGAPLTRPDRAAWIVSGYLLGYVTAMPLMGRIADIAGRRLIFTVCLVLFAVGSLFCGLAPILGDPIAPDATTLSGALLTPLYVAAQWLVGTLGHLGVDTSLPALTLLIGARFVQAIGGGALVPVGMAVVGDLFGSTRRGLALGMIGAVAEAGGVLGPLWGAWVTDRFGWQWIFYLNIPIAGLLLVAGALFLPRAPGAKGRLDLSGALLFAASLACLTLGLGPQSGQLSLLAPGVPIQPNPTLLVAAGALFAVFVVRELLARAPVIDVRLLLQPAFAAASLLSLLVGAALIVAMVLIPLFIISLQTNSDALAGGLALLRMTALIPVGALLGGWLANRFGCPPAALLGTLATAAGLYLMSQWRADVGPGQITLATAIAGVGFGLVIAPIGTSALNASRQDQVGTASAVVTVLRMTGMIVGLAGLTFWALTRIQAILAAGHLPRNPNAAALVVLHQVYSELFVIAAGIALASAVPALLLWRKPRAESAQAQEAPKGYASYVAPLT